jgi:hypothetical protein
MSFAWLDVLLTAQLATSTLSIVRVVAATGHSPRSFVAQQKKKSGMQHQEKED